MNHSIARHVAIFVFAGLSQAGIAFAGTDEYPMPKDNMMDVKVGTEHFSDCNPILPLWEHIPDGEPHVFEDPDRPGKYRVYIYGSHDTRKDEYCGTDLIVWSAPLEDLSDWRYDGVIYANMNYPEDPRLMFAPDVTMVEKNGVKRYYLYPNEQRAPRADVCVAERPDGPFVNIGRSGMIGFDPAVLVDDDGRVYAYWGFNKSFGAELDPNTMCTLKPGTEIVEDMVSNRNDDDKLENSYSFQSKQFRFFEASSIRKIDGMYVFVYSRAPHSSEYAAGLKGGQQLAYAYSTNPLGPWTYGGPIIQAHTGNIHGGLVELDGQWYIFYHRHTNNNWYCRQACVEPVEIQVKGDKVKIDEVEFTSMGFNRDGLNPYRKYPAAIACEVKGKTYIKATYDTSINCNPVVNFSDGSVLTYKYYDFDSLSGKDKFQLDLIPKGSAGTIDVMVDAPTEAEGGIKLGSISLSGKEEHILRTHTVYIPDSLKIKGSGKRAVYLVCHSASGKEVCELYYLKFAMK